jgi:tetratricopeptide (TPR) repeat protein
MLAQPGSRITPLASATLLCPLARLRGDNILAWTHIREGLPDGPATKFGDVRFIAALDAMRIAALLALDTGDLSAAKEWLETYDRWLGWSGAVLGQAEGQALWARHERQAGDATQALAHAERAFAHATAPRQPLALLQAHRLLGELDTETGRYDDAAQHLDASLTLATMCEAPYERALTLLAMAELHAVRGERDEATHLLADVRAICEPLGAKPALARAEALSDRLATG